VAGEFRSFSDCGSRANDGKGPEKRPSVSSILLLTRLLLRKPFPRFAVPATKTSRPGRWFVGLYFQLERRPPKRKVGLRSLWRTAGADTRQTFGFHHVGRCLEPRLLLKKSIAGHCRLTELRRSCKKNWPSCRFSLCPSDYRLNEQRAKIPPLPPNKRRAMKYNGDLICRSFAI
jgi:hypothetical protein